MTRSGKGFQQLIKWCLLLFLAISPRFSNAQSNSDANQGHYTLIYDSTYIWPDGHGEYDYNRKFISDVVLGAEGRSILSRPATPVIGKDDRIAIFAYTRLVSGESLMADTSDMVTRTLPGDRRWIFVNFRRTEPGATLHLEWQLNSKEVAIAGKRFLGRTTPVDKAVILLTVPETWHFNFALTGAARQVETIRPSPNGPPSATYSWTATDLPGLSREEYGPPIERMIPGIYFSYSYDAQGDSSIAVNWQYLARLYSQQVRTFIKQSSSLNPVADSISDHGSGPRNLAGMACDWLGGHFKAIESEITLGGNVNEALQRGGGSQAEAGAILQALFDRLKIPYTPYLVASKDAGDPLPQLPALFWFDKMVIEAYADHDTLWIDPFYQQAQLDILPFEDEGAQGLKLDGDANGFVALPTPDYHQNGKAMHLKLDFDSTGSTHGNATEIYSGAFIPEISTFLKGLDEVERREPWEKKLARSFPGAQIEDFKISPPDSLGKDFRIAYSFSTGPIVRPFADHAYIPMDILGRWSDLPALPSSIRQFPIELKRPRFELERITLNISPPFEVETLPASYSDNNDIGEVYSVARGGKYSVTITRGFGLKRATLPIFDYNSLRKFFDRARNEGNQHIILKRVD